MKTKELQQISDREVKRVKFSGNSKVKSFAKRKQEPHFKAHTDLKTREIEISHDENYSGNSEQIISDVTRHEIAHTGSLQYSGCPRTCDLGTKLIFEPIYEVLKKKKFSRADVRYAENALEDSLLHCDLNSDTALNGVTEFFQDVAQNSPNAKVPEFYSAHILLNTFLWGNKKQKKNLRRYLTNSEKVQTAVKNFISRTGLNQLRSQSTKNKEELRKFLMNESNWESISRIYAEEFSNLMTPGYALPLINDSGAGTKGREDEDDSEEGNSIQKERESDEYKRQRIKESEQKEEPLPNWIDNKEALKLIYEENAHDLMIKAGGKDKARTIPLVNIGKREFDPNNDDFSNVRPARDPKTGQIKLWKPRTSINYPLPIRNNNEGFPRNKWILLDCSGSMTSGLNRGDSGNSVIIPWGDLSRYHFSTSAIFGYLKYLSRSGLANGNLGLIAYSEKGNTRVAKGVAEIKELALDPEFGSTYLDMNKIRQTILGRDNLVFTISDGNFDNWGSIKPAFLQFARGQKNYFHLQIGIDGDYTNELREASLEVVPILTADLEEKLIDLTKQTREQYK